MKRFCRSLVASALLTGCVAGVANATTLSEEERVGGLDRVAPCAETSKTNAE